jgi:hypothetical protein
MYKLLKGLSKKKVGREDALNLWYWRGQETILGPRFSGLSKKKVGREERFQLSKVSVKGCHMWHVRVRAYVVCVRFLQMDVNQLQ